METNFAEEVGKIRTMNTADMQNVVRIVKYKIICEHQGQQVVNMFDVELGEPDPNTFTEFSNLTEEQVLSWVKASIGEEADAERRAAMMTMAEQMAATYVEEPKEVAPPWVNAA
jgi:hypothetical protein